MICHNYRYCVVYTASGNLRLSSGLGIKEEEKDLHVDANFHPLPPAKPQLQWIKCGLTKDNVNLPCGPGGAPT